MKKKIKKKIKKIKAMGQKTYIANSGVACPLCHSGDVTGGHIQIDGGIAWQEIDCGNCNASWTDIYKLTGYENLQMGTTAEEFLDSLV
jgi:transcription elongation factor Elf1